TFVSPRNKPQSKHNLTPIRRTTMEQVSASGLASKAMLVTLNLSMWSAKKHDKKVSKEVADNHGTTEKAGRYNKNLVPFESEEYAAVRFQHSVLRYYHYKETLPWLDDGSRILPATNFMSYTQQMKEEAEKFEEAFEAFAKVYPDLVDRAERELNGLFN